MKYVMMIHLGENWAALPNDEKNRIHEACGAWHQELVKEGRSHGAYGLQPPGTATNLRRPGGKLLVTDGPFVETKEVLGGFEIVDCADRDAALAVAKKFPGLQAGYCRVEVWPLVAGSDCRD